MFEQLVETRPRREKRLRTVLLSVTVHSAIVAAGVYGTLEATEPAPKPVAVRVDYVALTQEPRPAEQSQPQMRPLPRKGFSVLVAPVEIPRVLPDIDLNAAVTDELAFTGRGIPGGVVDGLTDSAAAATGEALMAFQVDRAVALASRSGGPRYPEMLRAAGVEGEVLIEFVVDTTGRVDMASIRVVRSSHDLFDAAVRQFLSGARYRAAEVGGRKVRQIVQQPFNFALTR